MPPDERKEGPGFTIVDRRGSAAEEEPLAAPPLPKVDFAGLALSLATSALSRESAAARSGGTSALPPAPRVAR